MKSLEARTETLRQALVEGEESGVEIAPARVVDVVADGRELKAEEALAGTKVAQVQQKVGLGAIRTAQLDGIALR